ncbi:MAG: hypothetical protein ACLS36_09090 [Streptococcus sp.]
MGITVEVLKTSCWGIPPGTTVRDAETGKVITDLVEDVKSLSLLMVTWWPRKYPFCNTRNPAPEIAENGEPGEERELQLNEDFG